MKNDAGELLVRAFALNAFSDFSVDSAIQNAINQLSNDNFRPVFDAARNVLNERGTLIASDTVPDTLKEFAAMIETKGDDSLEETHDDPSA